jgi:hypothetical protein
MKKFFKWTAIIVGSLIVILFAAASFLNYQTKKASPEATVETKKDGKEISVFYCRPSKKGREIFGGLVPYDKIWRTGANEATTFTSNKDLLINGQTLPAGKYTLVTIPGKEEWTVIWNSKQYSWGIKFSGEPISEREFDVLQVKVPVQNLNEAVEMFTISFEGENSLDLAFAWDKTKVVVPIK